MFGGERGALYRQDAAGTNGDALVSPSPQPTARRLNGRNAKDLVIGHFVLGEQLWRDLRSQPRKQITKQFALV